MNIFCFIGGALNQSRIDAIAQVFASSEVIALNSIQNFKMSSDSILLVSLPLDIAAVVAYKITGAIINISCDGRYVSVISGDQYELASELAEQMRMTLIGGRKERASIAPQLRFSEEDYHINNSEVLENINSCLREGKRISVYTDLNLTLDEKLINSFFINIVRFAGYGSREKLELRYIECLNNQIPSIFVTYEDLTSICNPENQEKTERVLVLTPRALVLGIEYKRLASPEYAVSDLLTELSRKQINPYAIKTIVTLNLTSRSEAIVSLSERLGVPCQTCDIKQFTGNEQAHRNNLSLKLARSVVKSGVPMISNCDCKSGIIYSLVAPDSNLNPYILL